MTQETENSKKQSEEQHSTENQSGEESPGQSSTMTQDPQDGSATRETWKFSHPALRNAKTPEEVEAIIKTAEQTVQQQGRRLNELETKITSVPTTPAQPLTEKDFWDDPQGAVRDIVQSTMEQMIQPFRQDLTVTNSQRVRDKLRSELPHFNRAEPIIDQLLQQGNFPDPSDEGLLRTLYFTAVGHLVSNGVNLSETSREEPKVPNNPNPGNVVPPQHRPSSAPSPVQRDTTPKLRELTEAEERMRVMWGMSHAEYLRWQNADADAVVGMERNNG